MHKKKLMIIGHGRHGKDTAAEMLRDVFGYRFVPASTVICEKIIWPAWGKETYESREECLNDRHSGDNRRRWFDTIMQYNSEDPCALTREILENSDLVVGTRSKAEHQATRHMFDAVLWIDRSEHMPPEDISSMELSADDASYFVDNNTNEYAMLNEMFHLRKAGII